MAICYKDPICNLFNLFPNDGCVQFSELHYAARTSLVLWEVSVMRLRAYVIRNVHGFNRADRDSVWPH